MDKPWICHNYLLLNKIPYMPLGNSGRSWGKARLAPSRPLISPSIIDWVVSKASKRASKASFSEFVQRPNERQSRERLYDKFTCKKMIDIYCLGSGVKYQTRAVMQNSHTPIGQLSWCHWWNFQPVNLAPNRYEKSFKMAQPTRKKIF